jgi:L-asparagine oxygenase
MVIPLDLGNALANALGRVAPLGADPEPFLAAVGPIVARMLPPDVVAALRTLAEQHSRECALLLVGSVASDRPRPPTPGSLGDLIAAATVQADGVILGIALLLGEPVAYAAEKAGALVQNVFPVRAEEQSPSNEGSLLPLELHTELVFSRDRPEAALDRDSPDFLVLSCLRADPETAVTTVIVDGRDLCRQLSPADVSTLRQPRFEVRAPYSFTRDGDGSRPWIGPTALIKGAHTHPSLAFDLACGTRALDEDAERALLATRLAAGDPAIHSEVRLSDGDVLVIDNRRCLHGRSSFVARYDGRDRWLQRVYVRRSLRRPDPSAGGRPARIL